MNGIECHITLGGIPLCQYRMEMAGGLPVLCGHDTLAEARRTVKRLRPKHPGWKYRIVRGQCPCIE